MFDALFSSGNKGYKLEDLNGEYRITQKTEQSEVIISMDRKLLIKELELASPGVDMTAHLQFFEQPQGYLIMGYVASFKTAVATVGMAITLNYQDVRGFELPKMVTAVVGNVHIPLNFSDYTVKKRN